ncbi:chorismate lyase [Pseudomaricurvus sp. HS19]|uniref:chorismate--pyruvate lyase family protein n=1 Tax=Pseudomaricurvus sp. HS19 TaxID=2692626 RepID=UPI00136DCAA6|nr:chorismate lyase [Pseudomaricurvus sp. HS19]MYM63824.1 chorismate lyase [Pseudomaricurvus sp. HS19]
MPTTSIPVDLAAGQARWCSARTLHLNHTGPLASWLQHPGSLTARLVAWSGGAFDVQLCSLRWGRAQADEARALGIDPRARVLIREVILRGHGQPWVWARSILPWRSLQGPMRCLSKLDNQPLGGWLFRQPGLERGPLQVARFNTPGGESPVLWGRRSVFRAYHKPVLVAEVFLPEFVATLR